MIVTAVLATIVIGAVVLWLSASVFSAEHELTHPLPVDGAAMWAGVGGSLIVAVAAACSPRRGATPAWLRRSMIATLVATVGLGAWLLIYARLGLYPDWKALDAMSTRAPGQLRVEVAWLVVPPVVLGLLAAAVVGRHGHRARRVTRVGAVGLGVAVVIAIGCAADPHHGASHDERIVRDAAPLLVAGVWLCLAHGLAFGMSHMRALAYGRPRPGPWAQCGTVVSRGPDPTVAVVVDRGWLAGVEVVARPFVLRTAAGDLPVPAGAAVNAALPLATITAGAGREVPLIQAGADVEVTGFVSGGADDYRTSARPVAGTRGMVVHVPRGLWDSRVNDLLVGVWKPCLAVLVAATLAVVPAAVALATTGVSLGALVG